MKLNKSMIPTILTGVASIGVVVTSVLACKGTKKNLESNSVTVKEKAKNYIPAVVSGVVTIGCIIFSNKLNRTQQAAFASACALATSQYDAYSSKVKEIYGEEAHQKIIDAIADEHSNDEVVYSYDFSGKHCLDFGNQSDRFELFYDEYSKRYFVSTVSKVLQAEYHLNRNFALGGSISLNEFYNFLGISEIDGGDCIGWDCEWGYYWIDFNHRKKKCVIKGNEVDCYIIEMVFSPETIYERC